MSRSILLNILIFVSLCIAFSAASECGVRKVAPRLRRVVNGEQSYPGQWPWFVTLHKKMEREPDRYLCGATLINEWAVVTGWC